MLADGQPVQRQIAAGGAQFHLIAFPVPDHIAAGTDEPGMIPHTDVFQCQIAAGAAYFGLHGGAGPARVAALGDETETVFNDHVL